MYADNISLKKFILYLPYALPLDWQTLLYFFRMHQIIGVEIITDDKYIRSFDIESSRGFLQVTNAKQNLILEVWAEDAKILSSLAQKVRQMFDLDLHPKTSAQFKKHVILAPVCAKHPYLRVPGGFEIFEVAINTILSQLVSVAAARNLLAKLVAKYGAKIKHPTWLEQFYCFPTPQTLSAANLTELGITGIKIKAIKELSKRIISREIDLASEANLLKSELLKIPGIGPWTVEYIAMRCFEDKNSFPAKDLILARYLKEYPELKNIKTWRSYLAIYLWQHFLINKKKI